MQSRYLEYYWQHQQTKRYYYCVLRHDLFDALTLAIFYGGMNKNGGQQRTYVMSTLAEAENAIRRIVATRKRHNYHWVTALNTFETETLPHIPIKKTGDNLSA